MDEPYIAQPIWLANCLPGIVPPPELPRLCPCDVCDPEPDDLPVPDYEIGGEA